MTGRVKLKSWIMRAGSQLLRVVPGSTALRLKRDVRDAAWLAETDAVVVSYPKSGRTFVRAMLSRLYQRQFGLDERSLLEFSSLRHAAPTVPKVLFTHAGDAMRTPERICVDEGDYAHTRVVLIARHPGDVAVSRYHHLKHRSRDRARQRLAEQPLESFIWTEQGGIPSIVKFLNEFARLPHVTIVRFEDFLGDPKSSLSALAGAIGIEAGEEDIAEAAEFGSFANLKTLERENYFTSARLRRARKGDEQSGKVRSGNSGGYREQLGSDAADQIDAYLAANLDPVFGYSAP